ncbi:MAG: hypothetical protein E5299_01592 [Burkholderia gladioli]|nr:MAG: hypothetical protein E5299_01592 [Burkholderia gladioli]
MDEQVRHAVDYADANGNLGLLRVDVTRAQRQLPVSALNRYVDSRQAITGGSHCLSSISTTVTGNCINRAITPRRTGHIRWPMNGTLAWRNRRNSTACSNGRMAWLCVVGTKAADDIDLFFAWNLVEQLGQSVSVSHILLRH